MFASKGLLCIILSTALPLVALASPGSDTETDTLEERATLGETHNGVGTCRCFLSVCALTNYVLIELSRHCQMLHGRQFEPFLYKRRSKLFSSIINFALVLTILTKT